MLNLHDVSVSAGKKKIISHFSFVFEDNKTYAVMGPNGSGKSTLAYAIAGHPAYSCEGKITLDGVSMTDLSADKRAAQGLFLSFQSPQSLSGIKVHQLLQLALQGKKDPMSLRKEIDAFAKKLHIGQDLLHRSLNDGASGGEKKKLEVLQAAVLDRKLQIFDEVDTGVDVDALKTIAQFLDRNKKGKTYIVVTHYTRILRYLKPDEVLIIAGGRMVKRGGSALAEQIEKNGYQAV